MVVLTVGFFVGGVVVVGLGVLDGAPVVDGAEEGGGEEAVDPAGEPG